ncbi:bifunctional (p)ppGpp synthetase/guanosine-3',5'-bis(diphosphate) 3'-pyrophosphohydrolase [Candidatus Peregrinibacteria bacterium]|nr:bifunctional (p)ppGpp synthetase/guanosine-3',5'-bis(diphosphate) 3'-pyrophosphohydrolase [Candidatus Peregrinibacteria bacterium]MBT4056093.1 bifunctional (p)ppGpp synthetase/guanosine-3',5'-bis(diphosphate) 3'-pyrophosphohydrolase [Candidatus Peregrinibacteria bacterium]
MDKWLNNLVNEVRIYLPQVDENRLATAYEISEKFYNDKRKKVGVGYMLVRPREVVAELMDFKPDEDTIVAAFFFDALDSYDYSDEDINVFFDGDFVRLLDGLKILKGVKLITEQSEDKIDLLRKLLIVMAKDVRVLVIFLASKVVQMKALAVVPDDCKNVFVKNVLDVFVPIASRLGVYKYKLILEDLCFKYLYPEKYGAVGKQMDRLGKKKNEFIENTSRVLKDYFEEKGFEGVRVSGRLKGVYSVYTKLERKGLEKASDLHDLFAVRVILPTKYVDVRGEEDVSHLYEILGMLHSQWKPVPSRFKDFIAVPKPNGYKSLHTAVVGLSDGEQCFPVEVQIRSTSMHEEAESGVASHWLYKDGRVHSEWVERLSDLHSEMKDGDSVLEGMETDIFTDRIYVLTPKGDVKELPKRSTPLDFAYFVHTDVGHRCVMAKVNSKIVPFDHTLSTGDTVEILTKKDQSPKLEWISIVKTSTARAKIRNWFASQDDQRHVRLGRDQLNDQLKRYGKPLLNPDMRILKNYAGQKLNQQDRENLLKEIGKGTQSAGNIIRKIFSHEELMGGAKSVGTKLQKKRRSIKTDGVVSLEKNVVVGGLAGVAVKVAKCCVPTITDKLVGYVSSKGVVTVHKSDCKVLSRLSVDKFVPVKAKSEAKAAAGGDLYRVHIKIEADKRIGLLGDVGSRIAAQGVSIFSYSPNSASNEDRAIIDMHVDVKDLEQFEKVLDGLAKVDGVHNVSKES